MPRCRPKCSRCWVSTSASSWRTTRGPPSATGHTQGRDPPSGSVRPIRGKILNTERARRDKVLSNNEVRSLISALGTSIGESFDISGLRYGRIISMTEADGDGSHIRTLLLTFFFRYMADLIEQVHLFIAQPPLYRS